MLYKAIKTDDNPSVRHHPLSESRGRTSNGVPARDASLVTKGKLIVPGDRGGCRGEHFRSRPIMSTEFADVDVQVILPFSFLLLPLCSFSSAKTLL